MAGLLQGGLGPGSQLHPEEGALAESLCVEKHRGVCLRLNELVRMRGAVSVLSLCSSGSGPVVRVYAFD